MAKEKISKSDVGTISTKGGSVTIQDERTLMAPLKITPANLVDDSVEVVSLEGLPDEFKDAETLAGFAPSPKFEKKGETVFGEFVSTQTDVGPNHSRLYTLSCPKGDGTNFQIAVWGSTALDRLIDSAYPPIQVGDRVAITYLGSKPTPRNQSPVKLFALKVKRMEA